MISQFDIPAWGGFNGSFSSEVAFRWYMAGGISTNEVVGAGASLSQFEVNPGHNVWFCESLSSAMAFGPETVISCSTAVGPGRFNGWFGHRSLLATVEGYNYYPISFSLTTFWLNEICAYFVDGENFKSLSSPGYQYKTEDSTNSVAESSYNLHYLENVTVKPLPRVWDGDFFSGWNLQNTNVSGSLVGFVARIFEQLQAALAILSGGTFANFGGEDTSSRVVNVVTESTSLTEDGEGVSVSDRLSRIESAVSQLIALTTYSYYISGASVDSAPASGQSVAEGVLNYLKQFLGDGQGS